MDIVESTRSYERWMAQRLTVVKPDLAHKHRRMAESAFVFLRGTFYRWTELWPRVCGALTNAPVVRAIGDLHVENFGTWRDAEGRLVWGVNDVDEACELPYTNDLVRLATSALLATRNGHFDRSARQAADAILDGYTAALERGGQPVVLAERRRRLRQIALHRLRDPQAYWAKLDALKTATSEVPRQILLGALPHGAASVRVARRVAGVGSLGRPRFVALAEWTGGRVAREAKAWLPSAAARKRSSEREASPGAEARGALARRLLADAVRAPDPFLAFTGGWIVRRLAPDCARIEIEDMPRERDENKLLRAMGWETANFHVVQQAKQVRADLRSRPKRWLERAAAEMAEAIERDWECWRRLRGIAT